MGADIRKISVGKDYPNGVIHYQVGKKVNLLGNFYDVTDILINEELLIIGKVAYDIFIADNKGKVFWKSIIDVPVVVENNINFK